MQNNQAND